jgi:hypothetical protein
MAYTINLTDGSIFATIADGTINTSSSMILVGKNYAGYGEFLDENFIHLLENGANNVAPGAPLTGQLWWDKSTATMKVYNGTTFKVISASTASATAPSSNVTGDLWFDTVNQQLKVYNGASFILVGPASTSGQGTSGAIVTTLTDNVSVDHVVIQLYVNNSLVGVISKDSTFTPVPAISGFATISPGIQLSTTVSNNLFRGTATDTQLLDGLDSTAFLRSDTNDTTSGTLGILNDSGITVGLDQDARISVTTATSEVVLQNQTQDANLTVKVNTGGTPTTVIAVNGSTSAVTIPTTLSVTGNLTIAGNVSSGGGTVSFGTGNVSLGSIINNNANGIGNIGSSSTYFNTIFAKATSAQYADVAERFAIDVPELPGTVVELGGLAEITKSITELSENVFGVISTQAAYLMNSSAGTDVTHPPIAMTGRVPVRVIGSIIKGDRLVSAGNGVARSALPGEATAFNVIGRALESKSADGEHLVEAIVATK